MPDTETLIALEDVNVERGGATLLQNISWTVQPGQHWVVFGPNGAGKTTLLNIILGYVWPTSGAVHILGETYGRTDVREMRRRIAVVSDPVRRMVNERLNGVEVLLTGPRAHLNLFEDPTPEEIGRARRLADDVGLSTVLLNRPYGLMSTGERQRVLIARALMATPRILILDEPAAGLDLAGREMLLQTIHQATRLENSPTFLLTTHHVEEITGDFSHALLLQNGRVYTSGPIDAAFTSAALSDLFSMPLSLTRINGRFAAAARLPEVVPN